MAAKWKFINPASLAIAGATKGGTMIMAVAAKKHVTLFQRSRRAPGAGNPKIKAAFARAARSTKGKNMTRAERNAVIAAELRGMSAG
jgi:hypothetical protein